MRRQQKLCFATLLGCIQLLQRFEEKEEEVSDWIKLCYRNPVNSLLKRFLDFQDFARQVHQFRQVTNEDIEDSRSEIMYLNSRVHVLLEILEKSFENLTKLLEVAPGAGFLRVLQQNIQGHASILYTIRDCLEESNLTKEWYSKLSDLFSFLQSAQIPTTNHLRNASKIGSNKGQSNPEFPKNPATVVIEDVTDDIVPETSQKEALNVVKESQHSTYESNHKKGRKRRECSRSTSRSRRSSHQREERKEKRKTDGEKSSHKSSKKEKDGKHRVNLRD